VRSTGKYDFIPIEAEFGTDRGPEKSNKSMKTLRNAQLE